MHKELLDTKYSVETPESIDLSAQLAGPATRILAYAIDLFYKMLINLAMVIVGSLLSKAGSGIYLVFAFLLEWFYPVLFEVLRGGQTPGKKAMSIAVVNDDLTPVTWSTSLIRNLLRAADFLPFGYFFGLVAMTTSKNFQRLGDLAAGSIVIRIREVGTWGMKLPQVTAQPPPSGLSIDNQVAFTGFSQRSDQLSQERKEELANILKDITHKSGSAGVDEVQGIGNWLLGERK